MPKANRYAKDSSTSGHETPQSKNKRFIYRVSEQTESPLFKLPLELRITIWELVLPRSVRPHLPLAALRRQRAEETQLDGQKGKSAMLAAEGSQYVFDNGFPLCRWQKGSLSLLRTCKRLNTEATRVLYAANTFDCIVEDQEPRLVVAYGDPAIATVTDDDLDLQRLDARNPRVKLRNTSWISGQRKLSTLKREHISLIRGWVLAFPTHFGLDFEQQADDAEDRRMAHPRLSSLTTRHWGPRERLMAEMLTHEHFAATKSARKLYRQRALFGVERWLQLIGAHNVERRFNHIELTFYRYFDYGGRLGVADYKLVEEVKKSLPQWLLDQIITIN